MSASTPGRTKGGVVKVGRKVEIPESELSRYRPTPRHPAGGGRVTAMVLLSLLVVVVIVVSVYAYTHIRPREGNTPEEAFLAMVDAINDTDAEALVKCTVVCLAEYAVMESEILELEVMWADNGGFTMVVHSYELVLGNATPYIEGALTEIAELTEATYSVEVVDFCLIMANYTTHAGAQASDSVAPFPFVKVGAMWYLAISSFPEGQLIVEPL